MKKNNPSLHVVDQIQSYAHFVEGVRPNFIFGPHHIEMFDCVDDVLAGKINILFVSMPPRHGKSESLTRTLPAYVWGLNPATEILVLSGRGELAEGFCREIRSLMGTAEYRRFFPASRLKTATSRNLELVGGGKLLATHLSGATGEGGHVIIVDDPVPNASFCDNELNLDRLYRSFTSDIMSRQMPMANGVLPPIIIISTRWHSGDLTGRLLEQLESGAMPGRIWKNVSYPAINKRGEALWPEMMPLIRLEGMKNLMTERDWECLYQQNPDYKAGRVIDVNAIRRYSVLPPELAFFGASDYALTKEESSLTKDETCHAIFGVDKLSNIYLVKLFTGMVDSVEGVSEMIDLMEQYRPTIWFGEKGIIRQSLEPFIKIDMQQRAIWTRLEWLGNSGNKMERAQVLRTVISSGRLFLPIGEPESLKVIDQFRSFGVSKRGKDDIVDTFSLFCRGLSFVNLPTNINNELLTDDEDKVEGASWMA